MKLLFLLYLSFWLLGHSNIALSQERVVDMRVRGNLKVESDAILTILKTRKESVLNPKTIREDIIELHKLGYFSDIKVFKEATAGGVFVTIEVEEKPAIVAIEYEGLEELNEEDFQDKIETQVYTIVNESTINSDLRMIEKQYLEKGFFLASARYDLVTNEKNEHEVTLKFVVDEGGKVLVGDVFIEGNEYFTDSELLENFFSKPYTRSSSFATPGSVYNEEFLKRDIEVTSYLYKDKGFAEVKVSKPVVTMDGDRKFVRISFDLEEGVQYSVGGLEISGDILYPKEDLLEWMRLEKGELFRFSLFRKDIEMLVDKYGDKGFAFVDVNPIHRFDREKGLVYLNYKIAKGQKVYFGEMQVTGNTKTRDNVIRRELDVADSELYSGTRLTKSKSNIQRLGFFEEVQSIKQRDEKDETLLNYRFKVKEKPTGQLQAAIGFSPGAGRSGESSWFGQGRYNEENQSGTGIKTNLTGRWNGGNNYSLELGATNPRVNDSRWSLGGSAFWKNSVRSISEGIQVQERRVGGSVTVGRRLFEQVRGSVTYRYAKITQSSDRYLLPRFQQEGIASSLIFGLSRDDTNNYLDPSEGTRVKATQRITGGPLLGGDGHALETRFSSAIYLPIDFTDTYRTYFKLNGEIGVLNRLQNKDIPFYDRYRQGGPDDMRGYRYHSLGPESQIFQSPEGGSRTINEGGNKELLFQVEYFFPIIPDANIKGLLFADFGRVFNDLEPMELSGFKRDLGFGFRWITPIAPFRFEWAYPVIDGEMGDLEFIFSLGY